MINSGFQFSGTGRIKRDHNWQTLKPIDLAPFDDPDDYQVFDADLVQAINTAMSLGMPLLLTGEPGVGKTSLATRIAAELGCECLMHRVKSSTEGADALYQIDHLGRMADANSIINSTENTPEKLRDGESGVSFGASDSTTQSNATEVKHSAKVMDVLRYIHFNALGKAILRTWPVDALKRYGLFEKAWPASESAGKFTDTFGHSSPSVVLIDEIDKAPSDVPNDLLEEVRTLSFELPYLGDSLGKIGIGGPSSGAGEVSPAALNLRPVVIITSNSERSLPQAFLRRCAYYHMKFPEKPADDVDQSDEAHVRYQHFQEALQRRIAKALGREETDFPANLVQTGWEYFWCLRNANLERKPSTAELLNWLTRLCDPSMKIELANTEKRINLACQLLIKQKDEITKARELLMRLDS